MFVAGLLGLVLFGPVRMSAASGQRHGGQLTLRLLLSSLPDSTGLGHSAPRLCAAAATVRQRRVSAGLSFPLARARHGQAGLTSGPSAIRSRCSCSPPLTSAGRFSWASLGSPSAASLGSWLACLAQSHLLCKPPAIPPSPLLASAVGKGPCPTVLRSASLPLGPVGPFTSW